MPLIADSISFEFVWHLDVVGPHALEHGAEEVELPVGIGHRRLGAGDAQNHVWLAEQQRYCRAGRRAEEYE